jgi:hypothetical protein
MVDLGPAQWGLCRVYTLPVVEVTLLPATRQGEHAYHPLPERWVWGAGCWEGRRLLGGVEIDMPLGRASCEDDRSPDVVTYTAHGRLSIWNVEPAANRPEGQTDP